MGVQTIGVALAIPEPWGSTLQRHRASFGDPLATSIPPHVTLVPPTQVDPDDLPWIERHLSKVASAHTPFLLHLRGTGTFRPVSPVVFVTVVEGISSCELLAAGLLSGPLAQQLMFPFHPHVTIAHDVPEEGLDRAFDELAGFDCTFTVASFHLYAHDDGVWRPSREFALG